MQPPVIFFIGPPQHGKTTAREICCKLTGLKGASCSDVIAGFLAARTGKTYEEVRALPKEETRKAFIEAAEYMCGNIGKLEPAPVDPSVDEDMLRIPSILIRTLYHAGRNVIDGVRRKLELNEGRKALDWNGIRSLVIWVEKTNGPKVLDNTELDRTWADEVLLNDGTIEDLTENLHKILIKYFPPPAKPEPTILNATGAVAGSGKVGENSGPGAILDSSGAVAGSRGVIKPFSAL